jgi:hypothetical protein
MNQRIGGKGMGMGDGGVDGEEGRSSQVEKIGRELGIVRRLNETEEEMQTDASIQR